MIDQRQILKTRLIEKLGSPWVLAPFMFGVASLTAAWTFDWKLAGLAAFAGLFGIVSAGGIFLTRLLLSGQEETVRIIQDLEAEKLKEKDAELDRLEQHLIASDEDPRPEEALRDLRTLAEDFKRSGANRSLSASPLMVEIHSDLAELFAHCVYQLKQSIALWESASQLNSPAARKPILEQRESIIAEIQRSVRKLSGNLVELKKLESGGDDSIEELKRKREEMDQKLKTAREVEARVKRLMSDIGSPPRNSEMTASPERQN